MKLNAALGLSLMQTEGPTPAGAAWIKALALAESVEDVEYQLRSVWALWAGRLSMGDYRTTLPLAQRFCSLAANQADPADQLIGDRMMGVLGRIIEGTRRRRGITSSAYSLAMLRRLIGRIPFGFSMTTGCWRSSLLLGSFGFQGFPRPSHSDRRK